MITRFVGSAVEMTTPFVLFQSLILTLCFLVFAGAANGAEPKKVAWILANSAYPAPDALKNPVKDADNIAQVLNSMGFEVQLDTNLSQSQVDARLKNFKVKAQKADIAVFYYAGHGLAVDGQNYVLPIDRKLGTWTGTTLATNAISLAVVEAQLRAARISNLVMMIDACRTPAFRGNYPMGMVAPKAQQGVLYLFSTLPGALARDGVGESSPFNQALVANIRKSKLSLKQVIAQVKSDMDASTAGTQIPWVADGLAGDINLSTGLAFKPDSKFSTEQNTNQQRRGLDPKSSESIKPFWSKYLDEMEAEIQVLVESTDVPRLKTLKQRADQGDSLAQVAMGYLYLRRNPPPAVGGNPYSGYPPGTKQYDLARQYEGPYTRTVTRNPATAKKYLESASRSGNPLADTVLGEMYYEGDGVQIDFTKSRKYLEAAAERGHGRAQLNLLQLNFRESGQVKPEDLLNIFKGIISTTQGAIDNR